MTHALPACASFCVHARCSFGELLFNDSTVTIDDVVDVGAWVARARYSPSAAASMQTTDADLDAVWEFCRYTSEATSLDLCVG